MTRSTLTLSTFWFAAFLLAGCDSDLIHNANVQRWCGDRPCGWQVEGDIERVGSWHDHDYAVSFVSDEARLSQTNRQADWYDASCFEFTMRAKIDPGVLIFLALDLLDDG